MVGDGSYLVSSIFFLKIESTESHALKEGLSLGTLVSGTYLCAV